MDNIARVHQIQLKGFRCFTEKTIDIKKRITLIEGNNGEGKTSFFEALYYACYLRSFRTYSPKELIHFDHTTFFIKVSIEQNLQDKQINVGFSHNKRLVKIDQKPISSYKDLLAHYRVVSLTEDDLSLVKGSPHYRRSFLDYALILEDFSYIQSLKDYQSILEQRNSFLYRGNKNKDMYFILTEQLWKASYIIFKKRVEFLKILEFYIAQMSPLFSDISIKLDYITRLPDESFDIFYATIDKISADEYDQRRSLIGAHLDDFSITLRDKKSKVFASRGQQKLIVLLIKMAHLKQICKLSSDKNDYSSILFLLDDFMTDFDQSHAIKSINLLAQLQAQLMFSAPMRFSCYDHLINEWDAQVIELTR